MFLGGGGATVRMSPRLRARERLATARGLRRVLAMRREIVGAWARCLRGALLVRREMVGPSAKYLRRELPVTRVGVGASQKRNPCSTSL